MDQRRGPPHRGWGVVVASCLIMVALGMGGGWPATAAAAERLTDSELDAIYAQGIFFDINIFINFSSSPTLPPLPPSFLTAGGGDNGGDFTISATPDLPTPLFSGENISVGGINVIGGGGLGSSLVSTFATFSSSKESR